MPTLVTPLTDSTTLRELCTKAEAAISSLNVQIDTLDAKITQSRERQEQLKMNLLQDAQQASEMEGQIKELEGRIKQAQVSASVAVGTAAEASTTANVARLQTELDERRNTHEAAREQYKKSEASTHKEEYDLQLAIDQADAERKTLQENVAHLEQTRKENHAHLGEALYTEGMKTVADIRATEKEHKAAARECGSELIKHESRLAKQLAEWPHLSRKAEKELESVKEPEPSPAAQVANALDHYLTMLEVYGHDISGGTPYIGRGQLPVLFSVPHEFVSRAVSTAGLDHATQQKLEERRSQLKEYVRQVAQLERDSRNGRGGW